jgi:tight adherence protein B
MGGAVRRRRAGRRLVTVVRPVDAASLSVAPRRSRHSGGAPRWPSAARVSAAVAQRPWAVIVVAAALAAVGAGMAGGPVASALAAVYGGGAAGLELRRRRAVRDAAAVAATLDTVAEMAAELRAGAAPAVVVEAAGPVLAATPAERRSVLAACEVSERTGAPLADVLDRVERYLRQANRLRQAVAANRAGTWATALLLAVLPAGGVAVGYSIGADPLGLLFHSPVGMACTGAACVLQVGGMWWTERLSRVEL